MYGANALLPAISIHALHEENDGDAVEDRADLRISIHALHEESDRPRKRSTSGIVRFQSTLSMRRATDDDPGQRHGYRISIHALHEESDMLRESEAYGPSSFQSTLSMRRATLRRRYVIESLHLFQSTLSMRRATALQNAYAKATEFQSTLSMRRATAVHVPSAQGVDISIHALHEESDRRACTIRSGRGYFNPRSP